MDTDPEMIALMELQTQILKNSYYKLKMVEKNEHKKWKI